MSTNWACPCGRTGVSSVTEPVFGEPVLGGVCEVMSATARPAAEIWAAGVTDWPPDPRYAARLVQHLLRWGYDAGAAVVLRAHANGFSRAASDPPTPARRLLL